MKKKGDLQFKAAKVTGKGYTGFALNTEGTPVAQIGIAAAGKDEAPYVSWALANREGRNRLGPHMLTALMAKKFDIEPTADKSLTAEGAKMARSAVRRGLLKPHPRNPEMKANVGAIVSASSADESLISGMIRTAHADVEEINAGRFGNRFEHFNTGARAEAKQRIFPDRAK